MDNNELFWEELKEGRLVFFAGSGISFLSGIPSAGKVLQTALDSLVPLLPEYKEARDKVLVDERNYNIQPEVFYETLLSMFDSIDSLLSWRCISPHFLKELGIQVSPNINHRFIIDYSVKNRVPIFTTNFDCLFEDAARELNYHPKFVLPYTKEEQATIQLFRDDCQQNGVAYIFKLHGSISDGEHETLGSLSTTMTSISKMNLPVLEFLSHLSTGKQIVFVGYSGRDIDYFPEMKKRINKARPIWIDEFKDKVTSDNSQYIGAIRIYAYPDKVFSAGRPDLDPPAAVIPAKLISEVPEKLAMQFKELIHPTPEDRILLLGQLIRNVSEYSTAFEFLLQLYDNKNLSKEKRVMLLLNLSSLAHENSLFESCGRFAREALRVTRHDRSLASYTIIARCQISESKRMLVPHDVNFSCGTNFSRVLIALGSFLCTSFLTKGEVKRLRVKKKQRVVDIQAIHNSLEHKIRLFAFLQVPSRHLIESEKFPFRESIRSFFIRRWDAVEKECRFEGYGQGSANTIKFESRITKSAGDVEAGGHIYELTVYKTGQELIYRNIAERLLREGDYEKSREQYRKSFQLAQESGNRLNAIKALFGIARCNQEESISPMLGPVDLAVLKDLISVIEGKAWQKSLRKILREIESSAKSKSAT